MAKAKPASKKIILHLGKQHVKFDIVRHRKVYTAYDLAQTAGEKLENVAKTLLVKVQLPGLKKNEERYYTVVVPASYYVELGKLKKMLGAKKIELVFEKGMKKLGMEPGALSPFGSMNGFGVVMDKALLKTKTALVGAESFTEHLRMKMKDFVKAENPILGAFGKKNKMKLQAKAKPKKKPSKGRGKPKSAGKKKSKKTAAKKRR